MQHNRFWNAKNPHQGKAKKVLSVCSAGLLRSPTIAWVLGNDPYNFNTRACGYDMGHALITLEPILLHWADEIVVVEPLLVKSIEYMFEKENIKPRPIHDWGIPDYFAFKDPELIKIIRTEAEKTYGN